MGNSFSGVSHDENPKKNPFECKGALAFFSMPVVELALDFPRHCIGKNNSNEGKGGCLYWIDDVFIDSCVSFTGQSRTKILHLNPS